MAAQFEFLQTTRGREPKVRIRFETEEFGTITLRKEVEQQFPQFPLDALSLDVYGRSTIWEVIADQNPLKPPWEWVAGEELQIPTNLLDAFTVKSQDRDLLSRKIL